MHQISSRDRKYTFSVIWNQRLTFSLIVSPSDLHAPIDATSNSHLTPRIDDGWRINWHDGQFGSRTYIVIAPGTPLPESQVMGLVNGARAQMQVLGAGVLPIDRNTGWMCHVVGEDGIVLDVRNANNHQVTRGVLLSALDALTDYMAVNNAWAVVTFQIFDGTNRVGEVSIGW